MEKPESIWRYSRSFLPIDPQQGWKIHISATILTACDVLKHVAPYLKAKNLAFKATATLDDLSRLNSGLWQGYSQVGKFITIYPIDEGSFCKAVKDMYGLLPRDVAAPAVPFDIRFRESNIYYRYGSFVWNGESQPQIRTPMGDLVPDDRFGPAPGWVRSPIEEDCSSVRNYQSPLATRYRVYRSISQRGKGGVYEAIDLASEPLQACIVKEGRRHGETAWDGRDGRWRVENEKRVLRELAAQGISVPGVLDTFLAGGENYLVLEKVNGTDLLRLLFGRKRRLPLRHTLNVCKQVASLLAEIHAAGWVWRDCKPGNLFLTRENRVRPVDFEGACRITSHDSSPWSTPNYSAPEVFEQYRNKQRPVSTAEDLFSLGCCLFFLLEGRPPRNDGRPTSVKFTRRQIPALAKGMILRLMNIDPQRRPNAGEVADSLGSAEAHLDKQLRKTRVIADGIE